MATAIEQRVAAAEATDTEVAVRTQDLNMYYGSFRAVKNVTVDFKARAITAIIGPSGAGKSTLLRTMNRINDRVPGFRAEGQVLLDGVNICDKSVDTVELRRRIGMVFQRPNPFPQSIYDNVAFGLRLYSNLRRAELDERVEQALRSAALWEDVKDKLGQIATGLSGGQQQRLCIARAIAIQPEILLMDEPASALDPISTLKIEELMLDLRRNYTIVIVTHNMQQASRASDYTVMMTMDASDRAGYVVEIGPTDRIFTNPQKPETEAYVSGNFG